MNKFLYSNLPNSPGVYIMKDRKGTPLYVGKAGNLRRRVSSYFLRPQNARLAKLVQEIAAIDHRSTDTALEALILEAKFIKELKPLYNIREKDDKSFLYVEITKEAYPRVLVTRGKNLREKLRYGPFTSGVQLREALAIIRKIFPWNIHPPEKIGTFTRPCFEREIGLCPGTCTGEISKKDYVRTIRNAKLFFEGKKSRLMAIITREMKTAAKKLEFERATTLRRQLFALKHIQDVALLGERELFTEEKMRIEGYDVSSISGTSAVGSMVVFYGGESAKSEYKKFTIQTIREPNDVAMLSEVLSRRFAHREWPLPALILVDGGKPQVGAARRVMREYGLSLPLVGLAKGPTRKKNELWGSLPFGITIETLIKVRDEAHRFAIRFHRASARKKFLR